MKRVILIAVLVIAAIACTIVANAASLSVNAGILQTQSIVADIQIPNTSTSSADCMDGGWANWKRANGSSFPNQGQCVSYVNGGGVLHRKS